MCYHSAFAWAHIFYTSCNREMIILSYCYVCYHSAIFLLGFCPINNVVSISQANSGSNADWFSTATHILASSLSVMYFLNYISSLLCLLYQGSMGVYSAKSVPPLFTCYYITIIWWSLFTIILSRWWISCYIMSIFTASKSITWEAPN